MEVVTIEAETFRRMQDMYFKMAEMVETQTKTKKSADITLLTVKEVTALTGFGAQTIKMHKEEIGYQTMGKDLRFKPEDVEAWINSTYRKPRLARYKTGH